MRLCVSLKVLRFQVLLAPHTIGREVEAAEIKHSLNDITRSKRLLLDKKRGNRNRETCSYEMFLQKGVAFTALVSGKMKSRSTVKCLDYDPPKNQTLLEPSSLSKQTSTYEHEVISMHLNVAITSY